MTVQLDFWNLVLLLLAFFGACAGAGRLLLSQSQKHLDERFAVQERTRADSQRQLSGRLDAIEQVGRDETLQWQRVERELLELKADLPLQYVRREDYVRGQSVLEAKQDALYSKLEAIQAQMQAQLLKGFRNG